VIETPVEIPGKEVGAVLEPVRDLEEKGTDIKTELKEATETVEAPETIEAEPGKEPKTQVAVPVEEPSVETPVEEVPNLPSEGAPTKEDSAPEETTEIVEDSASSVDSESFEKIEITEEPTVSEPPPAVEVAEKVEDVPTPVVVESPPSVESVEDSSFLSRYKTPVILGSLAAIGAAAVVHLAKKKNK